MVKQLLVPGVEEVCGPSPLCSCSVPQALGVSLEHGAWGDEGRVRKGRVHHNSWQGTTCSSSEHLSSTWDMAEVGVPGGQSRR